jgi:hypothetical protein
MSVYFSKWFTFSPPPSETVPVSPDIITKSNTEINIQNLFNNYIIDNYEPEHLYKFRDVTEGKYLLTLSTEHFNQILFFAEGKWILGQGKNGEDIKYSFMDYNRLILSIFLDPRIEIYPFNYDKLYQEIKNNPAEGDYLFDQQNEITYYIGVYGKIYRNDGRSISNNPGYIAKLVVDYVLFPAKFVWKKGILGK